MAGVLLRPRGSASGLPRWSLEPARAVRGLAPLSRTGGGRKGQSSAGSDSHALLGGERAHLGLGSRFQLLQLLCCSLDRSGCPQQLILSNDRGVLGVHPLGPCGKQEGMGVQSCPWFSLDDAPTPGSPFMKERLPFLKSSVLFLSPTAFTPQA